jgi:type III secretion protein J
VAALAVALALAACSGSVELMAAMPEGEANEVIAALLDAGIAASKVPGKEGMVGVRVEQDQMARAVETLHALGLPREQFAGMGDVFKKEGLISSPVEERARYLYALSQELSNTLSHLDGVLVSRVHLVLPERGSGGDPNLPSSAAVFLKYQSDAHVAELQPQVRRLVVNSIPGLSIDKVSVIMVPSNLKSALQGNQAWTRVLGFEVKPNSAARLVLALATLLLLALAGCAGSGFLAWRYLFAPRPGATADIAAAD